MKGSNIGEFEELILLAVAKLKEDAYGVGIQREMMYTANRSVAISAVHSALNRLESKGYLKSWLGDPTPERGGKKKRVFEITAYGIKTLEQIKAIRESFWMEIPQLATNVV